MQTDLHPACTRLHVPILAGADCEISWRAQTKGHAKSDAADEHEVDQSATVGLASAPGAPKKPASAYIHFCNEVRSQLKTSRPDIDPKDLMKALGEQWAATTDKVQYEALAKKEREVAKKLEAVRIETEARIAKEAAVRDAERKRKVEEKLKKSQAILQEIERKGEESRLKAIEKEKRIQAILEVRSRVRSSIRRGRGWPLVHI